MKSNNISVRAAVTAIGALCGAMMIPSLSYAVGAVQVNGIPTCASNTNMSMDPAGDIVINCSPAGTQQQPTNPPVCSVNVNPINITVGQSSNISASCTNSPTSYVWTTTGPAVSGAGGAPTFSVVGTYLYQVTATNAAGTSLISNSAQVVVAAATTGGGGGGGGGGSCTTTATGSYTGNSTKLIAMDRNGYASYALPLYVDVGRTLEILSIQSTASQQDLTAEFSISTCPGDFSPAIADICRTWGSVNQSGMQLYAKTGTSQYNGTCTLLMGTQYFLNARAVKFDKTTPSCTPQTCYMNMQLNSYM